MHTCTRALCRFRHWQTVHTHTQTKVAGACAHESLPTRWRSATLHTSYFTQSIAVHHLRRIAHIAKPLIPFIHQSCPARPLHPQMRTAARQLIATAHCQSVRSPIVAVFCIIASHCTFKSTNGRHQTNVGHIKFGPKIMGMSLTIPINYDRHWK